MLRATQLSGFGSGPVPASSVLDKPSPPDYAWKFDEFEITSTGHTELPPTLGSVSLYGAGGYQNNGIFVGSVVGGSGNVVQLTSASRYLRNAFYLGLTGDKTFSGWVKVVDSGTGAGTFQILQLQSSIILELTKDSSNLLEARLKVNGTVETFAIAGALNQWHHVVLRVTSGVVDLVFNGSTFSHGTPVVSYMNVDLIWSSSTSSFSSPQALYLDEFYMWGSSLTDAEIAYIHNGGAGRHLDASTGDFAGATVVPDPDHAWIVGSDLNADAAGSYDLLETGTVPQGSFARSGASAEFVRGAGTALGSGGNDDLAGSSTAASLSCWIYTAGMVPPAVGVPVYVYPLTISHYGTSSAELLRFLIHRNYGSADILIYAAGTTLVDTIEAGGWLHFAVVADGTSAKYFLNGALVHTDTPTYELTASRNVKVTAAWISTSAETGNPSVITDELYYWNAALSDVQVAALYNNGTGKFVNSSGKF